MNSKWFKQTIAAVAAAAIAAGSITVLPGDTLSVKAASSIDALFAGGEGTKANPYKIQTAKQFENIGKNTVTLKKNYVLVNDIDFKNATVKNIGSVSGIDMQNGDFSNAFSGSFNGNGHTISNVKVKQEKNELGAGLFEFSTGTVKNTKFKNITSKATLESMFSGGIVGCAYGGNISKLDLEGKNKISGVNCIGGIIGGSWGASVKDCSATGVTIVVNGNNDFSAGVIEQADTAECGGLLIGGGFNGSVSGCTAKGTVKATGNEPVGLGGIGGCLQCMDVISNNTVDVTIDAKNGHAIGGLCGYAGVGDDGDGVVNSPAKIKKCNVTVNIKADGATHVGGLIGTGLYYYGMEDRFNVINCSVKGNITGAVTPGTVAGRATNSTITSCKTDVKINGVTSTEQIGKTSQLYQSGDQYPGGSKEAATILLRNLAGSYQGLFETICEDKYFSIWKKYAASVVGADAAEATAKMLQSGVTGKKYGFEAAKYYASNPSETAFNCYLKQNVAKITVKGDIISGYDAAGKELFSHKYYFYEYSEKTGMGLYSFRTDDENAGEFTYFTFAPDTIDTTYHTEFRYGTDFGALNEFGTGKYAYWMAAGIKEKPDDTLIENVIRLFVIENLTEQ